MKGPINKESRISLWPGWLEASSVFFGLIVFVGLAVESGPEIWALAIHEVPLPRSLLGQALVAVGVFGEVAAGLFIARSAKREHIESSQRIAKAEQATAEAVLETAKIRERIADRHVSFEQSKVVARHVLPLAGQTLYFWVIKENEATRFATELAVGFEMATIKVQLKPFDPTGINSGLVLAIGKGAEESASVIEQALVAAGIAISPMDRVFVAPPGEVLLRIGPK